MIVAVHPDRAGGRPVGKALTGAPASLKDPATAVRYARHLMLDGVWRLFPWPAMTWPRRSTPCGSTPRLPWPCFPGLRSPA
jgi:hypothetical protein